MAVTLCMVPLAEHHVVSAAALTDHLRQQWPSLPEITDPADGDSTLSFSTGVADVILGWMPAPIPQSDLSGPCSTAMLWPEAATDLEQHEAHIIVTVSAELDEIAMSTLLTQTTASLLAVCEPALGVYWGNATKLIRKDLFKDFAFEIMPQAPPMHLWVDYRVGLDGERTASGFTTGMKSLGHMEFEAKAVPEPPHELVERMMSLGHYVIENGPVIRDGDTIGEDAREKIRVVYSDSQFGHPDQVMQLVYEEQSPSKPWWKLWS